MKEGRYYSIYVSLIIQVHEGCEIPGLYFSNESSPFFFPSPRLIWFPDIAGRRGRMNSHSPNYWDKQSLTSWQAITGHPNYPHLPTKEEKRLLILCDHCYFSDGELKTCIQRGALILELIFKRFLRFMS